MVSVLASAVSHIRMRLRGDPAPLQDRGATKRRSLTRHLGYFRIAERYGHNLWENKRQVDVAGSMARCCENPMSKPFARSVAVLLIFAAFGSEIRLQAQSWQPQPTTQGAAQLTTPNSIAAPMQNPAFYNNVVTPIVGLAPYHDPFGGYLTGTANLVNASGQFMMANQQAALMREEVTRSQIDTRNRIIQQRMFEASITPNTEDVRQQNELNRLRASRNNPRRTDIWSGDALNTLFNAIRSARVVGLQGPVIPISEDTLRHLNLSTGRRPGNIGMLRNGGNLDWPFLLRDDAFKKDRERLDELTPQAVEQATKNGRVDTKILRELPVIVERMQADLLAMVQEAVPSEYMDARRFLRELGRAYRLLQEPDVANYFGRWMPRGRTVGELIQHMIDNGLQFAAALPGDETFYTAFFNSLLRYDTGITQMVASQSP